MSRPASRIRAAQGPLRRFFRNPVTAPLPTAGSRNSWPTPASGTRRSAREAVAAPGHASRHSGPEGASALPLARRTPLSQIRHNQPGRNAPYRFSRTATTLARPPLTKPMSTAHRPPSTSAETLSTIPRTASNSGARSTAASCAATAPSRSSTTSPSPCEKPSPAFFPTTSLPFPSHPSGSSPRGAATPDSHSEFPTFPKTPSTIFAWPSTRPGPIHADPLLPATDRASRRLPNPPSMTPQPSSAASHYRSPAHARRHSPHPVSRPSHAVQ